MSINARGAAEAFLNNMDMGILTDLMYTEDDEFTGLRSIKPTVMEELADGLQEVIANVIASLINAGSEREVVMEDEKLSAAILNQLKEWGPQDD